MSAAQMACRCSECARGALDLATNGNGRWQGEWFAVPCNVGSSKMRYDIVASSYYWFGLVVSNSRYSLCKPMKVTVTITVSLVVHVM